MFICFSYCNDKNQKEQENNSEYSVTPLYFTERSLARVSLMEDYLKCHKLPKFDQLSDAMIRQSHRRFVVCIDIGRHNDEDLGNKLIKFTYSLLGSCSHIRMIIAHSSGAGLNHKHKNLFGDLELKCCKQVELVNFSDEEAREYLKCMVQRLTFLT